MQMIGRRDDDEVDAVRIGGLGRGHFLPRHVGALEKPLRRTLAGDPRVGRHRPCDDQRLAVELRGDAMDRSDEGAAPATDNTGAQAAGGLSDGNAIHG